MSFLDRHSFVNQKQGRGSPARLFQLRSHSIRGTQSTVSRPSSFSANKGRADEPAATYPERIVVEVNLKAVRPECDRPESPHDNVEVRIGRGLKYPKDRGYARFLTTLGYDRNWAGLLAARIVEEGRVRAAGSRMSKDFAQALRRVANPRLDAEAFLSNCKLVLGAMEGTTLIAGLFKGLPPFEGLVFIRELRFCVSGDLSGRADVIRIARAVWRRVVVSRGPKLSHASASHQYFLESFLRPVAFTWSPTDEDFTDRLTQATREEFNSPDFSPVSARRRVRARVR